jgi:hypothetical protein
MYNTQKGCSFHLYALIKGVYGPGRGDVSLRSRAIFAGRAFFYLLVAGTRGDH